MSLPAPSGKLWIYQSAVDLRKSYNSLSTLVSLDLGMNPESGDGYIFINRRKTLAKLLWWDRTGWCLLLKRLSAGRYRVADNSQLLELENIRVRAFFDGL